MFIKFIGGGIHVKETFIRSLMVGRGGSHVQTHFFHRDAHPMANFKYLKM